MPKTAAVTEPNSTISEQAELIKIAGGANAPNIIEQSGCQSEWRNKCRRAGNVLLTNRAVMFRCANVVTGLFARQIARTGRMGDHGNTALDRQPLRTNLML